MKYDDDIPLANLKPEGRVKKVSEMGRGWLVTNDTKTGENEEVPKKKKKKLSDAVNDIMRMRDAGLTNAEVGKIVGSRDKTRKGRAYGESGIRWAVAEELKKRLGEKE